MVTRVERRTQIILAGIATIIIVTAGVAVIVPPLLRPDVRIGFLTRDLHQLALRIALDKGYFLEEGLRVELVEFQSGPFEMAGFLGGLIDMGYVGAAPALQSHIKQGVEIRLLAGVNLEGSAIVVDADINTTLDMNDKRIATPAEGNVQDILLALACEQAGLNYQQNLTVQYLSPTLMIQQLQTGEIDGFVAWEPHIANSQAQLPPVGKILNTSHEIWPGHPCCVLVCQLAFLQAQPGIAEKVIRAHLRATEFIRTHHDETVDVAVAWTGLPNTTIEPAMSRILFNESLIVNGYQTYVTELVKYGYVPSMNTTQIDALLTKLVDPRFLS